jgi:hypothetical protein
MLPSERPRKVIHGVGLPGSDWEAIDRLLRDGEKRADFIHEAVNRETKYRLSEALAASAPPPHK